jgi:hypothetical protein
MLLSLRVATATKFTTVTVTMVLPGDCGTASALAAAMDILMPEARRQVPSPAVTSATRRAVVTNDSSGSYGRNSLSGIGCCTSSYVFAKVARQLILSSVEELAGAASLCRTPAVSLAVHSGLLCPRATQVSPAMSSAPPKMAGGCGRTRRSGPSSLFSSPALMRRRTVGPNPSMNAANGVATSRRHHPVDGRL